MRHASKNDKASNGGPRPHALAVLAENIPDELKALPRWVAWRYVEEVDPETGEVDFDKPPVNARTGGLASTTDPRTWSTFDAAMTAMRDRRMDGVGIVLRRTKDQAGHSLVAIDLDKCRDPETGSIEPWAAQIIEAIDSYSEVSPSGLGIRIFLMGQLPSSGRKKGPFECYETARYVTVTGHHIEGTPLTVEHRQAALGQVHCNIFGESKADAGPAARPRNPSSLSDLEIIERAKRATGSGPKFARLWDGGKIHASPSEDDLALCNYLAFWVGPDENRIADLFAQSGLFRSKWQREDYRRRTIRKALEGRTDYYSNRHERNGHAAPPRETATEPAGFANFRLEEETSGDRKVTVKVGKPIRALADELIQLTGGWPKRFGEQLFVEGAEREPLWLDSADNLFAWIAGQLSGQGDNSLRWSRGEDKVTQGQLLAYLQQSVDCFDAVEAFPHFPELPRHYYMHRPIEGGNGKALAELLGRFRPSTLVDADLIRGFFLSLCWGGAPGQRPAWLITSEDHDAEGGRGVGKSKLIQMGARLVGGQIDASPNEPMTDLITRLLSPAGAGRRVVLLDNLKTLRFSWSELEALVTSDVVSGKRLYSGEGRRPNTLTYCLTLNGASLSRDLAQRCNIVKLARPPHGGSWEQNTIDLIDSQRWAIIGDIIAALKAPCPTLTKHSRWAAWDSQVMARLPEPTEVAQLLADRRHEVDEDSAEADVVREAFVVELCRRGHRPNREAIWIPSIIVAGIVNEATNELRRPTNRATAYLRTLTISELRESRRGQGRGWAWRGEDTEQGDVTVPINPVGGLDPP
jgi:hypothetical protein